MAKILLVEDNEMIRDLASRRLKRRGYEVAIATDGAAGVEKARGEAPDLVLMDMGLPVIDGYEATRLLKANAETRHLPIIGLSAHAMSGDAQRALDAGCDDYDTKPIEWPRLLDKIQALLDAAEAARGDAPASAEASGTGSATAEPSSGGAFRVLVVDDSALNRDLLGRRLAGAGHDVESAVSGEEALARAAAGGFDAVLLDVAPGDLAGEEVLRRLRAAEATRELPVLMTCPVDLADRAVGCLAEGAADFVPQPFRPEILQARLQGAVERHRLREKERRARAELAEERKRADHLLRVLLPEPVVEELKTSRRILPRRHPEAAVLAVGVVGLDRLLESPDPATAIGHLQEVIGLFEDATARHGLEKVKTHRDLLLAAAGLYAPPPDGPVLAAVRCALELLEKSSALAGGLALRCGVHLGTAVSGVVGKRRYQFDVWGAAVRTAERVRDVGDGLHLTRAAWQPVASRVRGGEVETPAGPAYRVDALAP